MERFGNSAAHRMQQVFATRLVRSTDLQSVLDCVLEGGLELTGATLGNVQLMDGESGFLTIAAQRGFNDEFLDFFQRVNADHSSACGRALRQQRAIVIRDVKADEDFAPCVAIAERAGFRSVQSTPIFEQWSRFRHPVNALSGSSPAE